MKSFLAVGFGGALGSMLRYATGLMVARFAVSNFPFATLLVNIAGCFLIGMLFSTGEKYSWYTADMRLFFITGFCGGLTTFSAFALENWKLLQSGQTLMFITYVIASFSLTLMAIIGGVYFSKLI